MPPLLPSIIISQSPKMGDYYLGNNEPVRSITWVQSRHHRPLSSIVMDELVAIFLELCNVVDELIPALKMKK